MDDLDLDHSGAGSGFAMKQIALDFLKRGAAVNFETGYPYVHLINGGTYSFDRITLTRGVFQIRCVAPVDDGADLVMAVPAQNVAWFSMRLIPMPQPE